MEYLTPENLSGFVYILLGIAAVVTTVSKGLEAWDSLTGKAKRQLQQDALEKRLKAIESRLDDHDDRLDRGDQKFELITNDNEQTLQTLSTILMHMISGNDHEHMRKTQAELLQYLSKRR